MKGGSFLSIALGVLSLGPLAVVAQLSGSVGPTTSTSAKRAKKVCSVLDYGAKADKSTDIGPALAKAWAACASGGIGECMWLVKGVAFLVNQPFQSTSRLGTTPWQPG